MIRMMGGIILLRSGLGLGNSLGLCRPTSPGLHAFFLISSWLHAGLRCCAHTHTFICVRNNNHPPTHSPTTTATTRMKLCTTPYGGQEQPPPGMRPGSLSDPGPPQQVAATVGYVTVGAPRLTPVVLVQDAALDDKTVAWLLECSLAERQREEEEAVEAAVLADLEVKVAVAEGRLLVELQREREDGTRISRQTWATLFRVEQLAVEWYLAKDVLVKRRVKKKKKEKRRRTRRRRRWLVDVISSLPCIWQSLV